VVEWSICFAERILVQTANHTILIL
jgi:hypothetical protein